VFSYPGAIHLQAMQIMTPADQVQQRDLRGKGQLLLQADIAGHTEEQQTAGEGQQV
jgi:hypothetical protein